MNLRSTNPPPTRRSLLRRVPALRGGTDDELLRIEAIVEEITVPAGHELLTHGAADSEVSVIADGWAAVMVGDEPVAVLGPGDLVEAPDGTAAAQAPQWIVAKTEMRLITVPGNPLGT